MKIFFEDEKFADTASAVAEKMRFELITDFNLIDNGEAFLVVNDKGISLSAGSLSMTGDFEGLLSRLKINNLNSELVVKAARIKNRDNVTVIDATAGMGEDSFLLAGAGFNVTMIEYNPVIATLLEDTLLRANCNDKVNAVSKRLSFIYGNSIDIMNKGEIFADVVLLDPMFPKRQKSGLIKKKFQLLQRLECPCDDEAGLFESALKCAKVKVIVKRPAKGPFLADKKPLYSYNGNSIRYDVYFVF